MRAYRYSRPHRITADRTYRAIVRDANGVMLEMLEANTAGFVWAWADSIARSYTNTTNPQRDHAEPVWFVVGRTV